MDIFDFSLIFIVLSVCLHGFFGQDCAKKCNDACIGCNHVNGSCVSGCQRGWMGTYCQKGMNSKQNLMSFYSLNYHICVILNYSKIKS